MIRSLLLCSLIVLSGHPTADGVLPPSAAAAFPQADPCPAVPRAGDAAGPRAVVRYLASDSLEGRRAGSAGALCAARFLAQRFRALGLEPAGDDGTYFQALDLESAVNPHAPGGTGRNVVAILPGADPELAREAVVVGAHFDHLGRGGVSSLDPSDRGAVHNGADDNASGVAALLEAASQLATGPRPDRSVVFVAFTGEELGLLGSTHYARHPAVPLDRTVAMLNMDMVGRLGGDSLIVYGTGTADEWPSLLSSATHRAGGPPLAHQASGYGPSDHTAFYSKDIPVLHFFTNVHADYHRPSDDWQKLDYEGIRRVSRLVAAVAGEVADRRSRLSLNEGVGTPPSEQQEGGYGAYLGTVPDFTPVETGVRLSGVTDGSPASEAGLEAGDVIVGLGDYEVNDLYDLTDALRAHHPGDTVRVRVLRDGAELDLRAVLGSRGDRSQE